MDIEITFKEVGSDHSETFRVNTFYSEHKLWIGHLDIDVDISLKVKLKDAPLTSK